MKHSDLYMQSLTETVCNIMKKTEMTQQDIQLIMLYKSEVRRYEHVPLFKKILSCINDVQKVLKSTNNDEKNDSEIKENIIEESGEYGDSL